MFRFLVCRYRRLPFPLGRSITASSRRSSQFQSESIPKHAQNLQHNPSHAIIEPRSNSHLSLLFVSRRSFAFYAFSAAVVSAAVAAATVVVSSVDSQSKIYSDVEKTLDKLTETFGKIYDRGKQTGVAATVLWKSLRSLMSSANEGVRLGFELRVASLLADIVAASANRREAIVRAGGGAVVDWLLETVASSHDLSGVLDESARALSYLIADPNVGETVLGRPHAIPSLLKFIFSFQPQLGNKKIKGTSFDVANALKGRSMLIASIMDIVTSNSDNIERASFVPLLPADADMGDIAAALEVVEEGSLYLDEPNENDDGSNGDKGMRGIGIKILGGTTVLGFSRMNGILKLDNNQEFTSLRNVELERTNSNLSTKRYLTSSSGPGLWDDLQNQHVAVPFAAWALANWASSSELNRCHIQELDGDGHAVITALMAPERTVKWHGCLIARLLLEDKKLPLQDSVSEWSSTLLSTVSQASRANDISLVQIALTAFLVSLERSIDSRTIVIEKGSHLMREIARQIEKYPDIQEMLVRVLELFCMTDSRLSLQEAQRWSGILLRWICGQFSSESTRLSCAKVLSCILEDYGPASIPISQGWLTVVLNETIITCNKSIVRGNGVPKNDKIKTQIDRSNAILAAQSSSQLASAVVSLARNQLGTNTISTQTFPLLDLLTIDPFLEHLKNINSSMVSKFDAADSAFATLKGIKALTEICSDDPFCQNKIVDFGILCLLRRWLLCDDYEQLAAIEAYDASRVSERQEKASDVSNVSSSLEANDPSSVRIPSTAHIRRHAARLLAILSQNPKVKKAICDDEKWCAWLEDCANGKIPGCHDLKTQSYARATLLNVYCAEHSNGDNDSFSGPGKGNSKIVCTKYGDMIFLINPELPHWKCSNKDSPYYPTDDPSQVPHSRLNLKQHIDMSANCGNSSFMEEQNLFASSLDGGFQNHSNSLFPSLDIVFVHGLRGGAFKTWRIADNKSSTTSKAGLVEKIDQEAGKQGTFWPREWLSTDLPDARLFTVKYKTNLTQWSGASLPLQEVSSMLLKKLVAAGIGGRPVVFVTHSMGGLVVKQMLHQAKADELDDIVNNTIGVVFYSCPHFGSKLADMPWRMGLVFRPAPTIGELRSGSERLVELNDFVRRLHNKGDLAVLSFSETQVTPIVEGYGGWAFRMEIVPIESAYPGFGELVVLDSTDHINSCKPVNRSDPSYTETLKFLKKLKSHALSMNHSTPLEPKFSG